MSSHDQRGFSVIEFAVISMVVILVAIIVLPAVSKAANRDREAEVKSNIHTIQIALERYAVDTGGNYPTFLVGAERDSNIIRCSIEFAGNGVSIFPVHGQTPFAKIANPNAAIGPENLGFIMDPLIQFGYITEYPVNPFVPQDAGLWNSYGDFHGMSGVFPYGGEHGDIMFDLGSGWGDTPQTDFVLANPDENMDERMAGDDQSYFSDPDLDAPGNFYYHPIFNDMISVYFHYAARYSAIHMDMNYWASMGIVSDDVVGYYLYGYGASNKPDNQNEEGLDYFNRMPERDRLPYGAMLGDITQCPILDTTVGNRGGHQQRVETTGYNRHEYDPWTHAFIDGINPQYSDSDRIVARSGPDGVLDWVIIEVSSGLTY